MKRILITGGAGFIGSHLCEKLLSFGHEIFCFDNFSTGSRQNINHLINNLKFKLIEQDICEPIELNVDEIYNLASPASPIRYQKDPVQTIKVNVIGVFNVLELAKKNNAKILQASTSEVYGDSKITPQSEDYWGNVNPIGLRSCYNEAKRCAESIFFGYHRQHQAKIKIARIFNTYGARMQPNDGRVVSNFIVQAIKNEPITLYGTGNQTRSFCFIDDLIEGLIKLMDTDDSFTGPVNLGNPVSMTIKELAEKIISSVSSSSKITFKPLPSDDPTQRKPDISLAKNILDWHPKISFETGVLKTIEYFKASLN